MIARTETGKAANYGSMIGTAATGLVTIKEWIAARDARTRRVPPDAFDHFHMDGIKVAYDEKFNVKTKYGGFEQMLHPCDPSGSAGDVIKVLETMPEFFKLWHGIENSIVAVCISQVDVHTKIFP